MKFLIVKILRKNENENQNWNETKAPKPLGTFKKSKILGKNVVKTRTETLSRTTTSRRMRMKMRPKIMDSKQSKF